MLLVSITPTTGAYAQSKVNTHRRRATPGYKQAMPANRSADMLTGEGNEFVANDPAQFLGSYTAAFAEPMPGSKWFAEL